MKAVLIWSARHLFILAVGFYALMHSTWTLATLFLGLEPPQLTFAWFAWVVPAFVFAIAIDVGQIVTSVELRNGERTRFKYATFAVLAIATYYLQWWYLAVHMPLIPLSEGVSQSYVTASISLRDFALWVVPGLLPLSTFLYTFSFGKVRRVQPANLPRSQNSQSATVATKSSANIPIAEADSTRALPLQKFAALPEPATDALWIAECPACGWRKPCTSERGQINSLNAHSRHCPAKVLK